MIYSEAFAEGIRPDPHYTVSEWADNYRILPSKGAAEPGKFRTDRTPYAREIMDCLSPHSPVQRVVFMKSSQVGGTELGLNWLGCVVHMYPAPIMIVQPTIELAERFSKQRVAPMIDETPELRELIKPARTRDSGNSILLKEFRGGVLVMAGSNSGVSLRQMPVKYLFADEISGYEPDADGEGDPVSLAEKRTQTFGARKKVFLNSTPKEKDTCRIEFEYLRTDQRRYFVPCPHCGIYQWLKWAQMKWTDNDPATARYECEHCKELLQEFHKTKMLTRGRWEATAPSQGDPQVRGYHISALYSPLGWKSWAECVKEFLEAVEKQRAGDSSLLKAFVNSILGETWEEKFASKVGAEGLQARVETYEPGVAPKGVLALVAGVDVQDDRLSCSVWGYGRGEEAWLVSRVVLYGDPGQGEVWKQLDDVLLRKWRHEEGFELKIRATGIDTGGHYTHEVYQYARQRRRDFVLAMKGQSQRGKPAIGKPSKMDVNYKGQSLKHGVDLYPLGSDTVKTTLYGRFKVEIPGPGYVHFHSALTPDYFEEITSEKKVTRYVKGFPITDWVKPSGKRNEALDEAVMAYAALQFLYTRFHRATIWDQFEKALHVAGVQVEAPVGAESHEKPPEQGENTLRTNNSNRNMVKRRQSGFVTRW